MSHELRTPLNAIGGYADLVLEGIRGPVTETQRADLERIKRSQHHLLALINDILNFAKIEAGRVQLRRAPTCSIEQRARRARGARRAAAAREAAPLRVPPLRRAAHRARRSRAAAADPAQPAVERREVHAARRARSRWRATRRGDTMLVRVRDTGVGIPPDKLESDLRAVRAARPRPVGAPRGHGARAWRSAATSRGRWAATSRPRARSTSAPRSRSRCRARRPAAPRSPRPTSTDCHARPPTPSASVEPERLLAALERSQADLRLALDAGQMGTWEWDIAGGRVHWSPQEERLYGIPEGSFEGTTEAYLARIHPDDRARRVATRRGGAGAPGRHAPRAAPHRPPRRRGPVARLARAVRVRRRRPAAAARRREHGRHRPGALPPPARAAVGHARRGGRGRVVLRPAVRRADVGREGEGALLAARRRARDDRDVLRPHPPRRPRAHAPRRSSGRSPSARRTTSSTARSRPPDVARRRAPCGGCARSATRATTARATRRASTASPWT